MHLVMLPFGAVFFSVGATMFAKTRRFAASAVPGQGQVVGYRTGSDAEGGTTHSAVVEFTADDGRTVTFVNWMSTSPREIPIGTRVDIMFDPRRPVNARLAAGHDSQTIAVVFAATGLLALVLGLLLPASPIGHGSGGE